MSTIPKSTFVDIVCCSWWVALFILLHRLVVGCKDCNKIGTHHICSKFLLKWFLPCKLPSSCLNLEGWICANYGNKSFLNRESTTKEFVEKLHLKNRHFTNLGKLKWQHPWRSKLRRWNASKWWKLKIICSFYRKSRPRWGRTHVA